MCAPCKSHVLTPAKWALADTRTEGSPACRSLARSRLFSGTNLLTSKPLRLILGDMPINQVASLVTVDVAGLVPADLVEKARVFASEARAPRTRKEYRRAWKTFALWCQSAGLRSMPAAPDTVALYLAARADACSVSTLEQDLSAIGAAHRLAGLPSPRSSAVVREVRAGIRRRLGVAPKQKAPLLVDDLRDVVGALPDTLVGLRDRALLLVGFAGAFRRSELVALEVHDLEWTADGVKVTLRRSKTDQEGEGRSVGIPHGSAEACPATALRAWLVASEITDGLVFRGVSRHDHVGAALAGRSVARIVKRAAEAAGFDSRRLAGHSLRAGLATSAAKAGRSERSIMRQTGHRSSAMVRRYIREAEVFNDNAAKGLL